MTISPVTNSSIYAGLIDSIGTFPTRASLVQTVPAAYTEPDEHHYDLSGYYSDEANKNLFEEVANNVAKSAKDLDNAMVEALETGMGVQAAVNLNCAIHAYKANCQVARSTFELSV